MLAPRSAAAPSALSASRKGVADGVMALLRLTAVGFDAITIGIDDKRGVVVGPVVAAQAGFAVVLPTGAEGRGVKSIDTGAGRCVEAEVEPRGRICRHGAFAGTNPKGDGSGAVAKRRGGLVETDVAERLQGGVIKALCLGNIAHANGYVVDHAVVSCFDGTTLPAGIPGKLGENCCSALRSGRGAVLTRR